VPKVFKVSKVLKVVGIWNLGFENL
jgi:hypothetical protein